MPDDGTVRPLAPDERDAWLRLRERLWPSEPSATLRAEQDAILAAPDQVVLVATRGRVPVGFAEVSLRAGAEGCTSSPVAYLEGWYVEPAHRGRGIGRALVAAAEAWGRARGCSEFASDAEIENVDSQRAHAALGFVEVARGVQYRKPIAGD